VHGCIGARQKKVVAVKQSEVAGQREKKTLAFIRSADGPCASCA
jgi:hypothetical protein